MESDSIVEINELKVECKRQFCVVNYHNTQDLIPVPPQKLVLTIFNGIY